MKIPAPESLQKSEERFCTSPKCIFVKSEQSYLHLIRQARPSQFVHEFFFYLFNIILFQTHSWIAALKEQFFF